MKRRRRVLVTLASTLFFASMQNPVHAITLDSFDFADQPGGYQRYLVAQAVPGSPRYVAGVQRDASAIGGTRSVELSILSGSGELVSGFEKAAGGNPSYLDHQSTYYGAGTSLISYDGDDQIGLTNYSGLQLDLTEGGATALVFDIGYDLPFVPGLSSTLEFTLYDGSDPTGQTFSRGSFLLDFSTTRNGGPFQTHSLAFSALNVIGANGAADLRNIGAFSIMFDGSNAQSGDFGISSFGTNGTTAVPEPTSMLLLGAGIAGIARRGKRVTA